jgi:hypothetical protein
MSLSKLFKTSALFFISLFLFTPLSYGGFFSVPDSDSGEAYLLFSFFDLRDRETYLQITNLDPIDGNIHIQIYDVSNNCNENNFFDNYTPKDTHVYNLRDIQTNDGNPSGVVLPDGAYGIVVIIDPSRRPCSYIGNLRILDDNGYEYRTNMLFPFSGSSAWGTGDLLTFNYNTEGNITHADILGIPFTFQDTEVIVADITNVFIPVDIDIYNLDEVPFSCRNVIFACSDSDNPLNEALLEQAGVASVASFEYGINNAIPHSKGGELLCPGNNISDGIVTMSVIPDTGFNVLNFIVFAGLNNGNGRGSLDSIWYRNDGVDEPEG